MNNQTTLKYTHEDQARRVVENATKMMMIILGDDGKYWVVTPATAMRLEKAGYEILN